MLYHSNLENVVLANYFNADELVIVSGYVGPTPIKKLGSLPIRAKVICGMYLTEGLTPTLHSTLLGLQSSIGNIDIYYASIPVHAKCYVWLKHGKIVRALIGSANFTRYGLSQPDKEVLADPSTDSISSLQSYINRVLRQSALCSAVAAPTPLPVSPPATCSLSLLSSGKVPEKSGLNWGHSNGHVTPDDAYIAIRKVHIKNFPTLFPPKQKATSRKNHNDRIELIWDDGEIMEGLLEGNQEINSIKYPKQLSTSSKRTLGEYIRTRIGVPLGTKITKKHLDDYGRTSIDISLQANGIYYCDFSF